MSGQPTDETQCAFCQIRSAALAWFAALAAGLTFAATATPSTALADEQNGDPGAVFVQTNDISENSILA